METRKWASDARAAWRPDRDSAAEVERDVDRLISVAASAGYALPRTDAELVWLAHSAEHFAPWLTLDAVSNEQLLQVIEQYTRATVDENPAPGVVGTELANSGVPAAAASERTEAWRKENLGALESSNAYADTRGLPLGQNTSSDESSPAPIHSLGGGTKGMNAMRLIFLDFDGVLHEARGDLEEGQFFKWAPILAELIAPHPDVHVVVHSSWRHMHTPQELQAFMQVLAHRYLGAAPPGPRERAIREYLRLMPQARDYIVIDDAPEEFSRIRGRRLLICDPTTGLSCPDVRQRLATWLEGPPHAGGRNRVL